MRIFKVTLYSFIQNIKEDTEIKMVLTCGGKNLFLTPETYLANSLVLVYLYYLTDHRI